MRTLIGKGTFTKAYQTGPDSVEVVSTCPAKECYALFSEGNPFAPVISRVYDKENTYSMPLYPKMKAPSKQLNERGLIVYKALRKIHLHSAWTQSYEIFCKDVNAAPLLTEEEKENICFLASDVCNAIDAQDMRFEISPRNVSHDSEGNLILLDCFFSVKALKRARS